MNRDKLLDYDEMTPLEIRRKTGKYFTDTDIGSYIANLIWDILEPDFILEPYVGGGSLIIPFFSKNIQCTVNDIESDCIKLLQEEYSRYSLCTYKNHNFFAISTKEIIENWNIPPEKDKKFLIYSNP
ncbi:MAG: hypothetical protein ACFFD4_35440, partial [Candidatus Odinarchaeota archaeon]